MRAGRQAISWGRVWDTLLAVHVVLSLVLTGLLMSAPLGGNLQPQTPAVQPPPPPTPALRTPDVVAPWRLWVHLDQGWHVMVSPRDADFPALWQSLRAAIGTVLATGERPEPAGAQELAMASEGRVVGAEMPVALSLENWAAIWGAESPEEDSSRFDRVVVAVDQMSMYFLGSDGAVRFPLPFSERLQVGMTLAGLRLYALPALRPLTGEAVPGTNVEPEEWFWTRGPVPDLDDPQTYMVDPWVLVPGSGPLVASAALLAAPVDAEATVRQLFPEVSVVREVHERDGARIFTDGQRALRIYAYGAIEFTQPPPTQAGNLNLVSANRIAGEFFSQHQLWYPEARLIQYGWFTGGTYLAYASYGPALPLISRKPLMEVIVSGDRVTYFHRGPNYVTGESPSSPPLISAEQALAALPASALAGATRVYSVWLAHLVEFAPQQVPVPVWVIRLSDDGETLLVDARNGALLP